MDLKELLGEDLFTQVSEKLANTKVKLVDLSEGAYVDKNKYEALKVQTVELSDKIKTFDGVDIEGLKKQASTWETKYNEDISKIKKDYAIESALSGAKNHKAVRALLNMDNVKLDGDVLTGIDEQIKSLKESDPYLFKDALQSTGLKQGGAPKSFTKTDIAKMSTQEINANWGNPDFQAALK
ncbi:MAG: phage scaffolding protein [Acinetobacter sp.]